MATSKALEGFDKAYAYAVQHGATLTYCRSDSFLVHFFGTDLRFWIDTYKGTITPEGKAFAALPNWVWLKSEQAQYGEPKGVYKLLRFLVGGLHRHGVL